MIIKQIFKTEFFVFLFKKDLFLDEEDENVYYQKQI